MLIQGLYELNLELIPNSFRTDYTCAVCGTTKFCKYKITNRKSNESRYYCTMCYVRVASDIQRLNKMLNDPFFNIPDKEAPSNG